MTARQESGQTTTEFLMISGLITAVAIIVLDLTHVPFRELLQDITAYIIGLVADPPTR